MNHVSKLCPIKQTGQSEQLKCHNCSESNDESTKSKSVGHTTTSIACPVLQHALKQTMNRTIGSNYTSNVAKNVVCT